MTFADNFVSASLISCHGKLLAPDSSALDAMFCKILLTRYQWDSHFRVGGATGTDLQLADCPTGAGVNDNCIAASMLLHVTQTASGYFENVWAWVADHDLDNPADALVTEGTSGTPENVQTQVSIYGARGVLIESQGPCWFYGTASEHSTMYQYQLSGASEACSRRG